MILTNQAKTRPQVTLGKITTSGVYAGGLKISGDKTNEGEATNYYVFVVRDNGAKTTTKVGA